MDNQISSLIIGCTVSFVMSLVGAFCINLLLKKLLVPYGITEEAATYFAFIIGFLMFLILIPIWSIYAKD